jgi:hypothetical protein
MILEGNSVLEFVALTGRVIRTTFPLLHAGAYEPAKVNGLVICLNRDRTLPNDVLYLYFCTDDWRVDRMQAWNWPGGGPRADSTATIKSHADRIYAGLGPWTQVCPLEVARAQR